jgi:hypothetical protein
MMIAGAAIQAYGAIQQGKQAKAAANYNAQLRTRDSQVALDQANQEAQQVRWAGQRAQGSLLADYGASGVTSEGSPMDVLAASASQAKLDEETVLYKGRMKSTGFLSDAALNRVQGKNAVQQSQLNAASYLIGGAGQAGFAYARTGASPSAVDNVEA